MGSSGSRATTAGRRTRASSREKAGEKTARLALPLAVLKGLEGFAPIQNQLAIAIRNDALRRGVLSVMFQDAAGRAALGSRDNESLGYDCSNYRPPAGGE